VQMGYELWAARSRTYAQAGWSTHLVLYIQHLTYDGRECILINRGNGMDDASYPGAVLPLMGAFSKIDEIRAWV